MAVLFLTQSVAGGNVLEVYQIKLLAVVIVPWSSYPLNVQTPITIITELGEIVRKSKVRLVTQGRSGGIVG